MVGCFLLPPVGIMTQTFFQVFARTAFHDHFWATEEFWFFSMGIIIWLIAFIGLPRPLWLYVFGHELTHALWVWLMGGSVFKLKVKKEGGYILADRINTWIALAPYFFPIYSVITVILYGIAGMFWDVSHLRQLVFALIGITWGFHLTFTCWAIWRGQQDLAYGGVFFSLVVIYTANLVVLIGMFLMASPTESTMDFLREFLNNLKEVFEMGSSLIRKI